MKKKILILSGPTHEYFDPVRFIGNASSGLMGKAIAEEAEQQGYTVEFVTGPVTSINLPELKNGSIHPVISADEMLAAALSIFPSVDVAVFAAAVADYAPAEKQTEKLPKMKDEFTLRLRPTPDIAKTLSSQKTEQQISIGFALQTNNGEQNAKRKLETKKLDGIVLNTPATLSATTGTFSFLSSQTENFDHWGCIDKKECARRIIKNITKLQEES